MNTYYVPGTVLKLYNAKQDKHGSCPDEGYSAVKKWAGVGRETVIPEWSNDWGNRRAYGRRSRSI